MKKIVLTIGFVLCLNQTAHSQNQLTDHLVLPNYLQIPFRLNAFTGISKEDTAIKPYEFYNSNQGKFPKFGNIYEASTSFFIAYFGYSGFFCKGMVEKDSGKAPDARFFHSKINFTQVPAVAFSPEVLNSVINEYADQFWSRQPSDIERKTLTQMVKEMAVTEAQDPSSTKKILLSLCSVMISSFDAMVW